MSTSTPAATPAATPSTLTLSATDQATLSAADQQAILALKQQYAAQKAAGASDAVLQGINAQANAIRKKYSYSGGGDGSMNIALSEYDKAYLTAEEQAAVLRLKEQYEAAKAAGASDAVLQSYNDQANAIRGGSSGLYSGGGDGSQYIKLDQEQIASNAAPTYTAPTLPNASSQETYVNELYDAQIQKQLADLKAAYEANQNELAAAAQTIPMQYQDARNAAAAAYERQIRNAAEYAAAAGLNSGAAAQQRISHGVAHQNDLNEITAAEKTSLADLELQRTQLATAYNNAIAQAKAEGNYERAAALYQEAVRVDNSIVDTALNQANLDYQQYLSAFNAYKNAQDVTYQNALFEYQQQQDAIANQVALQKLQSSYTANTGGGSGGSESPISDTPTGSDLSSPVTQAAISGALAFSGALNPQKEESITSYAQLGSEAKAIADGMSRTSTGSSESIAALTSRIESAYRSGKITAPEVRFLMTALGVS